MRSNSEQEAYARGLRGETELSGGDADREAYNVGQAVRQGGYSESSAAADGYRVGDDAPPTFAQQNSATAATGKTGRAMAKNVALPLIGLLGIAKDGGVAAAGVMFLEHAALAIWSFVAAMQLFQGGFKSGWAGLFGAEPAGAVVLVAFAALSVVAWLALFLLQRFLPVRVALAAAVPLVWFFGLEHVLKLEFALKLPETWRLLVAVASLVVRCGFLGSFVAKARPLVCSPVQPKPTSGDSCMALGWISLELSGYASFGSADPATVNGAHAARVEVTLVNEDYGTEFVAVSDAAGCFWFQDLVPSLKYALSKFYVKVAKPDGTWADAWVVPPAPIPIALQAGKVVSLGTLQFSRDNQTGALGLRLRDEPEATRTVLAAMAGGGFGRQALAAGNGLPSADAILKPKAKRFDGNKAILPNVVTAIVILALVAGALSALGIVKF